MKVLITLLVLVTSAISQPIGLSKRLFSRDSLLVHQPTYNLLIDYAKIGHEVKSKQLSNWTRLGYVSTMVIGFGLNGNADARTHTVRHKWDELSVFANNDFWYLGVRHGAFIASVNFAVFGNYNLNKQTRVRFVKDTLAGILLGSVLFDLNYSWERSGRPVMDLANWYQLPNGNKIEISRKEMIYFNVGRTALGILLLL